MRPTETRCRKKVMRRVLVVDDEESLRLVVRSFLKRDGYEVELAASGEEALKLIETFGPDVILTDVRMPKMTGYEVCRALKEIESVKHIPVVILSAKGQDDEIETGKAAGAIDYILKPFDMAELQQRVNEILSRIGAS